MKASRWTEDNEIFAANLRYYIELSNKDQRTICKDLGLPEASLSNYVTGKSVPRYKTILALADYFGVTITDFIEDKPKHSWIEKQKMHEKRFREELGDTTFTDEEIDDLIKYAKFLIAKRK